MSQSRQAKAALRSRRMIDVREGAYVPAVRRERGNLQAENEIRGFKTDGLTQNLGALLMQTGAIPVEVTEEVKVEAIRPAPRELPNSHEHRIYKLCIVIDKKWSPIAQVYNQHFAVMLAQAFHDSFNIDIRVLDHLNDNAVVTFDKRRDEYIKYAEKLRREANRTEKMEIARKKAVASKKVTKVVDQLTNRVAQPIIPTGPNGKTLKKDVVWAIEKMGQLEQVKSSMTLPQLRRLHTKVYKQCAIAPRGTAKKSGIKKVAVKKVAKKIARKKASRPARFDKEPSVKLL